MEVGRAKASQVEAWCFGRFSNVAAERPVAKDVSFCCQLAAAFAAALEAVTVVVTDIVGLGTEIILLTVASQLLLLLLLLLRQDISTVTLLLLSRPLPPPPPPLPLLLWLL